MNQWIEQKTISTAIFGTAVAIVATVGTSYRQAIALSPSSINQNVKQSTVRIDGADNGSGVLFAKNDNGYVVLTNQHVVETPGDYQITTIDGISYSVTDIRQLPGVDLALVYFNSDRQYSIINRGNSDALVEGQKLHIAGYPGSQNVASNRTYRFMSESLIGFLAPSDVRDGYELIYSGAAVPGMSGSPIVNEEGQLIGIYGLTDIDIATGESYLYGIPLSTALKIATRLGLESNWEQTVTETDESEENSSNTDDWMDMDWDSFCSSNPDSMLCSSDTDNSDAEETVTDTDKPAFNIDSDEFQRSVCAKNPDSMLCSSDTDNSDAEETTDTDKPAYDFNKFPPNFNFEDNPFEWPPESNNSDT